MTDRSPDAHAIDVLAFCRQAARLTGSWPVQGMVRLRDSLLQQDPRAGVDWVAQGSLLPVTGAEAELRLQLQGRAVVALQCQRCLKAVNTELTVDRRFRFVRTEAQAALLDEASEDDVLVLEPRLDLAVLLEDEMILALPIVPMHDGACPDPLRPAGGDAVLDHQPPHPFAALAALRGRKPTDDGA